MKRENEVNMSETVELRIRPITTGSETVIITVKRVNRAETLDISKEKQFKKYNS